MPVNTKTDRHNVPLPGLSRINFEVNQRFVAMPALAPAVAGDGEPAAGECLEGQNAKLARHNSEFQVVAVNVQFHLLVGHPMEFDKVAFGDPCRLRGFDGLAAFDPNLDHPWRAALGGGHRDQRREDEQTGSYPQKPVSS